MTESRNTRPLQQEEKPITSTLRPIHSTDLPILDFSWSIRFHIDNHTPIIHQLRLSEKAIIGRADQDVNFMPDIDLAPVGGFEHGISRRHAMLSATQDYLLITDLGSTNGSRLNGHALRPNEPYRLDDGDMITIGQIQLRVEFAMVPVHEGILMAKKGTGTGSLTPLDERENAEWMERPILVVEDDQSVAQLLVEFLETLHYKAAKVHNVADAMRFIASQLPRAVLLDLRMPDYNGIEICRMLRNDMNTIHLPIFVLSGSNEEDDIKAVLDAGADVFLSKPVGLKELYQALQKYVGKPNIEA